MVDAQIKFLEELLRIPSLSGQEDALAEHLVQMMVNFGFRTIRDKVGNVIGEIGDSKASKTYIFLGHMDTAPGEIPVQYVNGRLYGRGAVDAKGPLAAFVLAAAEAKSYLEDTRIIVIGAVEEEAQSLGAHHLAETINPPDGVIIGEPSGWQGITLGYKGSFRIDYSLTKQSGHTAGDRSSPAEEAVRYWNSLVEYTGAYNLDRRPPRFDTLDPSLLALNTWSDGLQEKVDMEIGIRTPIGLDQAQLREDIQGWAHNADLTFPYHELPYLAEKNTIVVRSLLKAIRAEDGQPRFKLKTGTSDMNVVGPAWGCPMAAYGPGDSSLDHTPGEHISVAEFQKSIAVLTRMILNWQ